MVKAKKKTSYTLGSVLTHVRSITRYINSEVIDRRAETQSMMIALVADSSVLFIGPRGTSKTDLIRKFAKLTGLSLFDTLISPSTKPDQIFGPIDVPALANGISRYKIKNHAPTAEVLFFDELFKANGVVLNPMLWLLNEKVFTNGDEGNINCPIKVIFAASNEIPSDSDLAPLYDRFVIRHEVDYLATSKDIHRMFEVSISRNKRKVTRSAEASQAIPEPEPMDRKMVEWLRDEVHKVELPTEIREKVILIKSQIRQSLGLRISDRRLVRSLVILQATALLKGRMKVKHTDLHILAHIFWDEMTQIKKVAAIVGHHCDSTSADLQALIEAAQSVYEAAIKSGNLKDGQKKLKEMLETTSKHKSQAAQKITGQIEGIYGDISNLIRLRTTMTILRVADQKPWWKLADESASLWSQAQIRSLGFTWRRRGGYWWQLAKSEQKFKKKAAEGLKTTVTFKDLLA